MDAELYAESVEYELLTRSVYEAILRKEGDERIEVKHNLDIKGRSGVAHQVDVSWKFKKATIDHHVLVECKNYTSAITLEKVRNFFAVLHDIGNCQGVMVTKAGYQSGVVEFARYYGIGLKLLRQPTAGDWVGRIKDIQVNIHAVALSSSAEKCPRVELQLAPDTTELKDAIQRGELTAPAAPDMAFVDAQGVPLTQELRWWLPKMVAEDNQPVGGPYTKKVQFDNHYLEMPDKCGAIRRVKVAGLVITYHYELIETRELVLAGEEIVAAILKDFFSGDVEHVHRKEGK